jgi:hypothetical protein
VCYVDRAPVDAVVSVRLIRAEGWDDAKQRAVIVGRTLERHYENHADEPVDWRLAQVLTLDELPDGPSEAREVYSYRAIPEQEDREMDRLDPLTRPTTQTGI